MAVILPTKENANKLTNAARAIGIYNILESTPDKWYKPSDIGKLFKKSGADVNTWLLERGLQERTGEKAWRPSKIGMPYSQEYQYNQAEGANKGRIKWSPDIIKMLLGHLPRPAIQDAKSNEVAVHTPVKETQKTTAKTSEEVTLASTEDESKLGLEDLDTEDFEDTKEDYILHSLAMSYGDPELLEMTGACTDERSTQLNEVSIHSLKHLALDYIRNNIQGPESRASIAALLWEFNSEIAEEFSIDKEE
ncbi:MAG: hypothetical protein MJK15_01770 [Colwellia sp.]|nr:hypothetical protein [Colwellia sp.]